MSRSHPAPCRYAVRCLLALAVLLLAACASTQRLDRQVLVVTGASSGFGKGVALRAAEQGASVVLGARRAKGARGDGRRDRCPRRFGTGGADRRGAGGRGRAARAAAIARYGRIDVWINNAGVGVLGAFDEVPVEDHARVIDVNLNGVIYGSHAALRQFRAQAAGTLPP